jgi:hypothetical protein
MADNGNGSKKAEAEHECPKGDVISVGPDLGGFCPYVRHFPDHSVQTGIAKLAAPGEMPATASALYLKHRGGSTFDVQAMSKGGSDMKGPAKVNSESFRTGWDNIFGNKAPVGQA